jgi:hypothetical protein
MLATNEKAATDAYTGVSRRRKISSEHVVKTGAFNHSATFPRAGTPLLGLRRAASEPATLDRADSAPRRISLTR